MRDVRFFLKEKLFSMYKNQTMEKYTYIPYLVLFIIFILFHLGLG